MDEEDPERDGLRLRFAYRDTDGTGEIEATVSFSGFRGQASAWFGETELLRFAVELLAYPLTDVAVSLSGGYSDVGGPFEELVGLEVRPRGRRGQVGVTVHLRSPSHPIDHQQPPWSNSEVRVEVLTSYEALRRFSSEVEHLVAGSLAEAQLDVDIFD